MINETNTNELPIWSQDELLKKYSTKFRAADSYTKTKGVWAEKATPGEQVKTITSSGIETTNTAKENDYKVTNDTTKKEKYLIDEAVFNKTYDVENAVNQYYIKKALIFALIFNAENFHEIFENGNENVEIYILAPWNEKQIVRKNDYLVANENITEIYRIDKQEFEQTYKIK